MNVIKATIRNGRIETDEPINLPDGTEVFVPVPDQCMVNGDDWDNTPEGITAWLDWYDSLEPLIFTDQELAALESDRRVRAAWEQAHFEEHADALQQEWQ